MKRIFILSGLLLTMLAMFSCSEPKQLMYQNVKNFRVGDLNLTQPALGMDIQFYNPNNFALTIKEAGIDVFLNDNFVGRASLNGSFDVPGLDTFLMPVTLRADLKNIFPNALQILFNKEILVRLDGNVKAGRGVYFNVPVRYQGRQKLNVF